MLLLRLPKERDSDHSLTGALIDGIDAAMLMESRSGNSIVFVAHDTPICCIISKANPCAIINVA